MLASEPCAYGYFNFDPPFVHICRSADAAKDMSCLYAMVNRGGDELGFGDDHLGEARHQPILPDLITFFENPPAPVVRAKKSRRGPPPPWALLFDPEDCDKKHAGKTLQEMELMETDVVKWARTITELREQLRWTAATAAS